jgi:hypothetical protein
MAARKTEEVCDRAAMNRPDPAKLQAKIASLQAQVTELEESLGSVSARRVCLQIHFARHSEDAANAEAIHKTHIALMHTYNERCVFREISPKAHVRRRKDAALTFIGQLASMEGTTSTQIYKRLDLALDD